MLSLLLEPWPHFHIIFVILDLKKFPVDLMFQLTDVEWTNLRSQIVTFIKDTRKYKPFVFTEHGNIILPPKFQLYYHSLGVLCVFA